LRSQLGRAHLLLHLVELAVQLHVAGLASKVQ
jgi:hypothetical protein